MIGYLNQVIPAERPPIPGEMKHKGPLASVLAGILTPLMYMKAKQAGIHHDILEEVVFGAALVAYNKSLAKGKSKEEAEFDAAAAARKEAEELVRLKPSGVLWTKIALIAGVAVIGLVAVHKLVR